MRLLISSRSDSPNVTSHPSKQHVRQQNTVLRPWLFPACSSRLSNHFGEAGLRPIDRASLPFASFSPDRLAFMPYWATFQNSTSTFAAASYIRLRRPADGLLCVVASYSARQHSR